MYGLVIVLLLAALAYRFLQDKRSVVPPKYDVFMRTKYDVFMSFRGPDTRKGFANFLHESLVEDGFHVFRDDTTLPFGENIGPTIFQAIRRSRIAILIISEHYAQSKWCLRELTEIIYGYKKHSISVFPIFYKVDVKDVYYRRGKFGKAFQAIQCKPEEMREREEWKKALQSVTRIKGWKSESISDGREAPLVKMVVAKVSSELKTTRIEHLPGFPLLMSNYHIRSAYSHILEKKTTEVFLAFHGSDTQDGFAAHLYNSLLNAGIKVFSFDDPSLIGTYFAHEIRNAINQCRIFIPILSKNYALSTGCLDELAQMVECKKRKRQKIMPIFYKVKPSSNYGEMMLQHKEWVKKSIYEQWEQALKEVRSIKGWESEKIANGNEGILVQKVVKDVKDVLRLLSTSQPIVTSRRSTKFLNNRHA